MSFRFERAVRFDDVDAAGLVYFPRFLGYCHEAMEALFSRVPGGYVDLIGARRVGFPAVHVTTDFTAPLRYGDTARIETRVVALGRTSCRFRYELDRARDGVRAATVEHVCVCTDLEALRSREMPEDVRALLTAHMAP